MIIRDCCDLVPNQERETTPRDLLIIIDKKTGPDTNRESFYLNIHDSDLNGRRVSQ
jgi:hypothetical protein